MVFSGFKASRPRSKTSHSSSSEARQAEEDYSLHIEQQIRVQKWLEEIPDMVPQATNKSWTIFRERGSCSSLTVNLEEWEDVSLYEALQSTNRGRGMFCCFRGLFPNLLWRSLGHQDAHNTSGS